MRKQYYFRPSSNGYYAWDVDKLIIKSQELQIIDIAIDEIKDLDEPYWYSQNSDVPTCRSVIEHMKLINAAEINFPVILSAEGRVMDGMHPVAKAALLNRPSIKAVKFPQTPDPDFENVFPDELSYE